MVRRYRHPVFALQYELSEGDASHLGDREWYAERLREVRGPVLELGAGTGRLTMPLVQDGHDVVALDIGSPMLAILAGKARAVDAGSGKLRMVAGDMTRLPFGAGVRFAAALCGYNALACLLRREDVDACFREAARLLPPGALFLFDVGIQRPEDYQDTPKHFDWQAWTAPDGQIIRRRMTTVFHREAERLDLIYEYQWADVDGPHEKTVSFALMLWPPSVYVGAAEAAGFRVVDVREDTFTGRSGAERMWFWAALARIASATPVAPAAPVALGTDGDAHSPTR